MEAVSAADQENKRKPPRAGSVPPRATTPVNSVHSYVPGVKTGVVTPAVRPGSSIASQSVPNKRQRLGDSTTPNYASGAGRAPLGAYRGGNGVVAGGRASPTKIPSKTPSGGGSSLPRPGQLAMPVPKPGTQHHALGHGRVPSSLAPPPSAYPGMMRSTSAVGYGAGAGGGGGKRFPSASAGYEGRGAAIGVEIMKKASRARRESFKPRPSIDHMESIGVMGMRYGGGFVGGLKEEDEDY